MHIINITNNFGSTVPAGAPTLLERFVQAVAERHERMNGLLALLAGAITAEEKQRLLDELIACQQAAERDLELVNKLR